MVTIKKSINDTLDTYISDLTDLGKTTYGIINNSFVEEYLDFIKLLKKIYVGDFNDNESGLRKLLSEREYKKRIPISEEEEQFNERFKTSISKSIINYAHRAPKKVKNLISKLHFSGKDFVYINMFEDEFEKKVSPELDEKYNISSIIRRVNSFFNNGTFGCVLYDTLIGHDDVKFKNVKEEIDRLDNAIFSFKHDLTLNLDED